MKLSYILLVIICFSLVNSFSFSWSLFSGKDDKPKEESQQNNNEKVNLRKDDVTTQSIQDDVKADQVPKAQEENKVQDDVKAQNDVKAKQTPVVQEENKPVEQNTANSQVSEVSTGNSQANQEPNVQSQEVQKNDEPKEEQKAHELKQEDTKTQEAEVKQNDTDKKEQSSEEKKEEGSQTNQQIEKQDIKNNETEQVNNQTLQSNNIENASILETPEIISDSIILREKPSITVLTPSITNPGCTTTFQPNQPEVIQFQSGLNTIVPGQFPSTNQNEYLSYTSSPSNYISVSQYCTSKPVAYSIYFPENSWVYDKIANSISTCNCNNNNMNLLLRKDGVSEEKYPINNEGSEEELKELKKELFGDENYSFKEFRKNNKVYDERWLIGQYRISRVAYLEDQIKAMENNKNQ